MYTFKCAGIQRKFYFIFVNFFFPVLFLSSPGHPLVFGFDKNGEFRIFLSTFKVCKLCLENRLVPELPGRAAF